MSRRDSSVPDVEGGVRLAGRQSGGDPIRSVRVGDPPESLRAFFRDALAEIYPYLLRRTAGDRATAEDLCQDTFVTAVRASHDGSPEVITIGWMITVARSRLIDHYRSEARRQRHLRAVESEAEIGAHAGSGQVEGDVLGTDTVERLLDVLPPAQRLNVALHHLDGMSIAEIAEATGTSPRSVESSLARARRTLRREVDQG